MMKKIESNAADHPGADAYANMWVLLLCRCSAF